MYGRGKFLIFTPDAPIVASPAAALVVYELPPQKLPSDFLCHELSRAQRACNINKFSAEIRPRCAISVRSAGDRRKGVKMGEFVGEGTWNRQSPSTKLSVDTMPEASRGGLKLLTRLELGSARRKGRDARAEIEFPEKFRPVCPFLLSFCRLFFTRCRLVSPGNQSYFMNSLRPGNVVLSVFLLFEYARESFSWKAVPPPRRSEMSNENVKRRGEQNI